MPKVIKISTKPDLTQKLTLQLLGEAVRARRTQSSLKIEDAAALCMVAKQTFADIENGQANCRIRSILKVCAGLEIELRILPWNNYNGSQDEQK